MIKLKADKKILYVGPEKSFQTAKEKFRKQGHQPAWLHAETYSDAETCVATKDFAGAIVEAEINESFGFNIVAQIVLFKGRIPLVFAVAQDATNSSFRIQRDITKIQRAKIAICRLTLESDNLPKVLATQFDAGQILITQGYPHQPCSPVLTTWSSKNIASFLNTITARAKKLHLERALIIRPELLKETGELIAAIFDSNDDFQCDVLEKNPDPETMGKLIGKIESERKGYDLIVVLCDPAWVNRFPTFYGTSKLGTAFSTPALKIGEGWLIDIAERQISQV